MNVTKKVRVRMQLSMFKAAYKLHHDLGLHDRFVTAILVSSDDAIERAMRERPELVEKYIEDYTNESTNTKIN